MRKGLNLNQDFEPYFFDLDQSNSQLNEKFKQYRTRLHPYLNYSVNTETQPKISPNQMIGELTTIEKINSYLWKCTCSCGEEVIVHEALLLSNYAPVCENCSR